MGPDELERRLQKRLDALGAAPRADRRPDPGESALHGRAGQPGQGERRESATEVRLDGDEMAPDADDGDAGHATGTYMT
jgi:hypothetical protein